MSKKTSTAKPTKTPKAKKPVKAPKAPAEVAPVEEIVATAPQLPVVEPEAQPAATDATVANDAATAGQGTATPAPEGKPARKPKEPKADGKMSGLDAAALVLKEKGEPMTCGAMIETMLAKGLWSTNGKTPASTLYSAILREIDTKPGASRFVKTGRGTFGLA